MTSTLIIARSVYAPGIPDAQALLVNDGLIAWIGDKQTARQFRADAHSVVEADELFVAPGFVDAHVHLSASGLNLLGFNASAAQSFKELAQLVNDKAILQSSDYIYLQGWDDSGWTDDLNTFNANISAVARDRTFYLARIDGHSALVNGPWFAGTAQIVSGSVREAIWSEISNGTPLERTTECIKAALYQAASNGVVAVHENGGPTVSSEQDFKIVKSLEDDADFPVVHAYWADTNTENVLMFGALGAAGDLSVDGSIGSRTAKLFEGYNDAPNTSGLTYLEIDQIATHIITTTKLGIQGGFHAIGDEACARVHAGFEKALSKVSKADIRACRHRIEHLTMPSLASLQMYSDLGVVASVQPAFDAIWGATGGMYESRLGSKRLQSTHPFADMIKAGMVLAFGSDSPVTEIEPWNWIRAATQHNQIDQRISLRAAFNAATRGGHRASRNDSSGVIEIGAPADLAFWQVNRFAQPAPNDTASSWSTDPRSGTHALPDLSVGDPKCVLTLRNGRSIYDPEGLLNV